MRLLLTFAVLIPGLAAQSANPEARGVIGVGVTDPAAGRNGALVGQVQPGGPADKAGLKPGDLVVAINGTPVDRASTMGRMVSSMTPGETARLTVIRGGAERLTIAVIIGSPGKAPAAPPTNTPVSQGQPARSLTVSGYTRLTDPLEQAFTVEVPTGWRSECGLVRHSALQINPYVRALSPDKMTYLMIGEPSMPTYAPPSEIGLRLGYKEGTLYDSGLGGRMLIMRYLSGVEFARRYGQIGLGNLCPALQFVSSKERPDLARKADAAVPTVIPSRSEGGEAVFTCTHGKQEMEARMAVVTRITRDNVYWAVIALGALIAPRGQSEQAQSILTHIFASMNWSDAWTQKQNYISRQSAEIINRSMQQTLRQQAAFIQKLNAVDQNFESMDEIINGNSHYHDARTGQDYYLTNANPYKWIDDSTGRIIGTSSNTPPPFGYGYRALPRKSQ